jgi:hypothetical protein
LIAVSPGVSDLAVVSGLDHQEVPLELAQKPFAENRGT